MMLNTMKRTLLVVLAGILFALPVVAQDDYPKGEIYGGFVVNQSVDGTGVDGVVVDDTGVGFIAGAGYNFHRNVGLGGEISRQSGTFASPDPLLFPDIDFTQTQYLFGPRFSARMEKATPFVHLLVGLQNTEISSAGFTTVSDSAFMLGVGGGVDININDRVAIRAVQVDYLTGVIAGGGFLDDSHKLRLSFGVVIKLGGS